MCFVKVSYLSYSKYMWIFIIYGDQYLKIMRFVLLKFEGDISKEIEPNIFLLNSSILMNFNRADKIDVKQI